MAGKKKTSRKIKESKAASKSHSASNLVIVESPAKAKTINRYLGSEYVVEASMGHVRDLPRSRMGLDMNNGFEPQYIIMTRARKTVSHLKKIAQGKKCVYLAPDPDREGEAISWHLAHILKDCGAKIHRVVFNEITKDAVLQAFRQPREIDVKLVDAQQGRRVLDRVVGYNLSPLLWKKIGRGLSAGRVQSVALKFIVEREEEIRNFKPEEYWSLHAELASIRREAVDQKFRAKLDKIDGQKAEIKTKGAAEAIKAEAEKAHFQVISVNSKTRQRKPQAPYTTSKLQQEAFTRLGFSAQKTMVIAQKLYEGVDIGSEGTVGLITYMRTDSVNVSEQSLGELRTFITEKFGNEYLPESPNIYKSKKQAQEAHEAIRPTSSHREPEHIAEHLESDELKLYGLIWSKFVASQMKPAIDNVVTIEISAGKRYIFKTTGSTNVFPGFSRVFGDVAQMKQKQKQKKENEEDEEEISGQLPPLKEGEPLKLYEIINQQHFTKPPPRFNDASLVKLLEENGIGRPSTYAPTIQTIVGRGYVQKSGGALRPSELGDQVTKLLVENFADVMDTKFTAYMEEELDKIEEGQIEWVKVVREFYTPFEKDLEQARVKIKDVERVDKPTDYICDVCGKPMVIKWGRFGQFVACTGFPDCRYTRSIPTGFRCPEPGCNGDLVKLQSKQRRSFYGCSKYPNCKYTTNKLPEKAKEEDSAAAA